MTYMTALDETTAIQADAEQRVAELRAVARRLFPDRDDGRVLSELHSVLGQLRQAESELGRHNFGGTNAFC
jgi:signal transduction histidine kinase